MGWTNLYSRYVNTKCSKFDDENFSLLHLGQNQVSVRFQFEESVSAFCAGLYGSEPFPCFAYSTFNDKIVLFPNIHVHTLKTKTLDTYMNEMFPGLDKLQRKLLVQKRLYGLKTSAGAGLK